MFHTLAVSLMVSLNLKRVESVFLSPRGRRLWIILGFKFHGVMKSWNCREFSCIYAQCPVFFQLYDTYHLYFNSCFFLTYVFLILSLVNKWENLAKFYFVAWRYLAIIHSSSFEQFLESTTMFLMKKYFAFWWKKCGNSWLSYGGRGSRHECKTKVILRWRWCYCVIFCPLLWIIHYQWAGSNFSFSRQKRRNIFAEIYGKENDI